ncbi:MAG TPA: hypothetical protein ENI15_08060 [Spirochaetes bacterium]|nr:hypothetical protein [Spirochaetota bacterium]
MAFPGAVLPLEVSTSSSGVIISGRSGKSISKGVRLSFEVSSISSSMLKKKASFSLSPVSSKTGSYPSIPDSSR